MTPPPSASTPVLPVADLARARFYASLGAPVQGPRRRHWAVPVAHGAAGVVDGRQVSWSRWGRPRPRPTRGRRLAHLAFSWAGPADCRRAPSARRTRVTWRPRTMVPRIPLLRRPDGLVLEITSPRARPSGRGDPTPHRGWRSRRARPGGGRRERVLSTRPSTSARLARRRRVHPPFCAASSSGSPARASPMSGVGAHHRPGARHRDGRLAPRRSSVAPRLSPPVRRAVDRSRFAPRSTSPSVL